MLFLERDTLGPVSRNLSSDAEGKLSSQYGVFFTIPHQTGLPASFVGLSTARNITEEVVDVIWNLEVLVRVETERSLHVGHFFDAQGSSVYVGGAGFSRSEANCRANIEKGGLDARPCSKKRTCDG